MAAGTGQRPGGGGEPPRRHGGDPAGRRRSVVDYALQRRSRLADVYAGRTGLDDVCDAHPYLLRAAKFHGTPAGSSCPVCRKEELTAVHYVYGDALRATAGQAKSPRELTELAARLAEFSVYVVEVCRSCGWNHLAMSYVLGQGRAPQRTRRAATE